LETNSTADDHDIDTIRRNNASFGGIEKRIDENVLEIGRKYRPISKGDYPDGQF
jgi:hypothetical protein